MDFYVIGHLTLDNIVRGVSFKKCMGGTAYYSSMVAKILGWNVGLISKVGFDFPREYLKNLESFGINMSRVKFEDIPS
ncbi:MAG: PfkB family carbohydrate kinase, partial [Candidatus Methanomethylicia archaeon]